MQNRKIVVVGAGNVGEAIAYTLTLRQQAEEIVLIDLNEERAKGAAMDVVHATGFYKNVKVKAGGYNECSDADIIIITAGIARKPGQTRLDLAKINIGIITSVTNSIMEYAKDPLIIVVSNPADITTMVVQKVSGLPKNHVIGSGTSLDTARFRYALSRDLDVNVSDIDAYVIGEHGDSQVPVYSNANISGIPLSMYLERSGKKIDKEAITSEVKTGGAQIIKMKGATFYGVAMSVSTIVDAIFHNTGAILPVSYASDDFNGVAFSRPCKITSDGITLDFFDLYKNCEEYSDIEKSINIIRTFAEETGVL